MLRLIFLLLVTVPTLPSAGFGQSPEQLSLADRAYIASKIYSLTNTYFAHWSAVGNVDFEASYKRYLERALAARDRREFDLASIEFVERLRNAHTHFSDEWLTKNYGQPLGFRAKRLDSQWVITETTRPSMKPGDVITALDGTPVDDFLQQRQKYRYARKALEGENIFWTPYVFPMRFTVTLAGKGDVSVDRSTPMDAGPPRETTGRWLRENKIAYIAVPSFGDARFEKVAVDFVRQFKAAEAIIVDVRGNGCGTSQQQLIDAIMDRPYRNPRIATPLQIGAVQTYRDLPKQFDLSNVSEYARGGLDAFSEFDNGQFVWGGGPNQPKRDAYTGKLLILVDERCASACEDFVIPFKDNHRATIIGETTWGSTGQPYIHNFGNGMMAFVSTKRIYMPDGAEFEGVGISPDVAVSNTKADIASGHDRVLDKAVESASEPGR